MNRTGIGWGMIILGGVFQIIWAIGLDYTDGFTLILWDIFVILFVFLSIWCLSYGMGSGIPVSTSYTVWIGIGVVGTLAVSAILGIETIDWVVAVFLSVTVGGVIGLKMTTPETK